MTTPFFTLLQPAPGFFHLRGEDRIAFLQRQSTNDLRPLNASAGCHTTVLTTPAARILDVLRVFSLDSDTLGVLTLPGRGADTATYLRSRIFFMDKVEVLDAPDAYAHLAVIADAGIWEALQVTPPLPEAVTALGEDAWLLPPVDGLLPAFYLLAPQEQAASWMERLQSAGCESRTPEAFERWRIHTGLPGPAELCEAYTPLEIGLDALVAQNKGCYTGQEVLARQRTYDKVTRHLVALRGQKPFSVGAVLTHQGKRVGEVTSALPEDAVGLGVVRRPHHTPGSRLETESQPVIIQP